MTVRAAVELEAMRCRNRVFPAHRPIPCASTPWRASVTAAGLPPVPGSVAVTPYFRSREERAGDFDREFDSIGDAE